MDSSNCKNVTVRVKGKDVPVGFVNNKGVLVLYPEYTKLYGMLRDLGKLGGTGPASGTIRCFYLPEVSKITINCSALKEGFAVLEQKERGEFLPTSISSTNSFFMNYPDLINKITWESDENVTVIFMDSSGNSLQSNTKLRPIVDTKGMIAIQTGLKGEITFQHQSSQIYLNVSNKCNIRLTVKVSNPMEYYVQHYEYGVKIPRYIEIQGETVPVTYSELLEDDVIEFSAYPNFKELAVLVQRTFMYYSREVPVNVTKNLKADNYDDKFLLFWDIPASQQTGNSIYINWTKTEGSNVKNQNNVPRNNMKQYFVGGYGIKFPKVQEGYDIFVTCCFYVKNDFELVNGVSKVDIVLKSQYNKGLAYPVFVDQGKELRKSNISLKVSQYSKYKYWSAEFRITKPQFENFSVVAENVVDKNNKKVDPRTNSWRFAVKINYVRKTDFPEFNGWDIFSRSFVYNNIPNIERNERTVMKTLLIGGGAGGANINASNEQVKGGGGGRGQYAFATIYTSVLNGVLYELKGVVSVTGIQGNVGQDGGETYLKYYSSLNNVDLLICEGGKTTNSLNGGSPGGGGGVAPTGIGAGGSEGQGPAGENATREKGGNGATCNINPEAVPFKIQPVPGGEGQLVKDGGNGGGAGGIKVIDSKEPLSYGAGGNGGKPGAPGIACMCFQYVDFT